MVVYFLQNELICYFSGYVKGTEESTLKVDSSVPLMHHDLKDFGLIC